MFSEGFGSSDSEWSTFVELAAEPLRQLMDPEVREAPVELLLGHGSELVTPLSFSGCGILFVRLEER